MATTRVLFPPTAAQEPVPVELAIAQQRLDLDAGSADAAVKGQLELLKLNLSAARELVEAFTGQYFGAQTLEITFTLSEAYVLPPGAVATGVSGFFTSLASLPGLSAYLSQYRKGAEVSRDLPLATAFAQTYAVTARLDAPVVPSLVRSAILELAGEWFRNREATRVGPAVAELPVSWRVKLAPYVVKPLGY